MRLRGIPAPTLERLAGYLHCLSEIDPHEMEFISSEELGKRTQTPAELVRRDLSYFGEFGRRGVGYNIVLLKQTISKILRLNRRQELILVGAGNLGMALLAYPGWDRYNLKIVAAFDTDPEKIGRRLWGTHVYDAATIGTVVREMNVKMAVLTVPAGAAQATADQLVAAGIRGILNFAPVPLAVPKHVVVRNVSFITEMAVLSYYASADTE